jgi:hypothetical protein
MTWLKKNKGKYFCHACVSEGTGVKPHAQVNQIIRVSANRFESWQDRATLYPGVAAAVRHTLQRAIESGKGTGRCDARSRSRPHGVCAV